MDQADLVELVRSQDGVADMVHDRVPDVKLTTDLVFVTK